MSKNQGRSPWRADDSELGTMLDRIFEYRKKPDDGPVTLAQYADALAKVFMIHLRREKAGIPPPPSSVPLPPSFRGVLDMVEGPLTPEREFYLGTLVRAKVLMDVWKEKEQRDQAHAQGAE